VTAKDAGGIASRLIAVYLAVQAIENGSMTAFLLQPAMRYASRRPVPAWPSYAISAGVFAIGAVLFWLMSSRFWPGESESDSEFDLEKFKRIVFSLLGAYLLITNGATGLIDIFIRVPQDLTQRSFPNVKSTIEFGAAFLGLCLIIANSARSPLPDFDRMR